jgi:RND family efflux transporter MFP subunit
MKMTARRVRALTLAAVFAGLSALALVFTGVSAGADKSAGLEAVDEAKSMERLHEENGLPVRVRELAGEDFSVYLKYPTVLDARSESTAYAAQSDVVRKVAAKAGDRVTQNQVLVSFSEDNRAFQQAKFSYENAQSVYSRTRALFNSGSVSRADFEASKMQLDLAAAAYNAARDTVYVKAPLSGTIIQVNVRTSENVGPGAPLFTISGETGLVAKFYVGIDEISRIKTGARVFIVGAENELEGAVTDVALRMDERKHAFPVIATFAAQTRGDSLKDLAYLSGIGVDVAVETYRNESALVVSRSELVKDGPGYAAFTVHDDRAKRVRVEVGAAKDLDFEIIGGLTAGDLLVCDDVSRLSDGAILNVVGYNELTINTAGK